MCTAVVASYLANHTILNKKVTTLFSISLTWTVDDRTLVHVEEDIAEICRRKFSLKKKPADM